MKPITLEMSAFGPYEDKITIDFDQFRDDGIFLITGPTGGGKTTIFDALTFALYGEASGNIRESKNLRCDFASNKVETYVIFKFLLKNKIYQIKRVPSYTKPGNKNPTSSQAELLFDDGTIISTTREVNKEIIKLLGIEVNQFKQIAMIAQGEFTKLIHASSDEKEKIFRKLFNTFKYQKFEDELKTRYLNYKKIIETNETMIDALKKQLDEISDINTKEWLNIISNKIKLKSDEYNKLISEVAKAEEILTKKNQLLEQHRTNNKNLDTLSVAKTRLNELKECEESIAQDTILLKKLNDIVDIKAVNDQNDIFKEQLKRLKESEALANDSIKTIDNKIKLLQNDYDNRSIIADNISNNQIKLNELRNQLKKSMEKMQLLKVKNELKNRFEKMQSEKNTYSKKIDLIAKQIADNVAYIESQKNIEIELLKLEQLSKDLTKELQQIETINKMQSELNKKISKQEKEILKFQDIKTIYTNKNHEIEVYENNLISFEAGLLASKLVDGKPCPVCGSLEHTNKAIKKDGNYNIEFLNQLKKELTTIQTQKETQFETLHQINQNVELTKSNIEMIMKTLNPNKQLDEYYNDIKQSILGTKNDIEKSTIILNKCNSLKAETEVLKLDESKYINKLNEIDLSLQDILKKEATNEALLSKMVSILDEKTINDQIAIVNKNIVDDKEKFESIENEYNKLKSEINKINGNLLTYQDEIIKINKEINTYDMKYKKLLEQRNLSENDYCDLVLLLDQIVVLNDKISNFNLQVEKVQQEIKTITSQLSSQTYFNLEEFSIEITTLRQEKEILFQQQQAIHSSLQQFTSIYNDVKKLYQMVEDKESNYRLYYDLYNTTSGNNVMKISFERYILSAYFEQILEFANMRFKEITNHRYVMIRKTSKNRGQSGLDIEVRDYESGTIRDIKTLSGGETFKAALSLALGMSDMIQNYAGGIEMNTLFIDEGFGSLDADSLTQAMRVLVNLSDNHKLIGIISHVQELKEQIDRQILIKKDNSRSYIEIK